LTVEELQDHKVGDTVVIRSTIGPEAKNGWRAIIRSVKPRGAFVQPVKPVDNYRLVASAEEPQEFFLAKELERA